MSKNGKVVVFGSFVTDLTARTPRFPRAGETVMGTFFKSGPGGKGSNQAVAARRAGGTVSLITRLGDDAFGREALAFYRAEGLDVSHTIIDPEASTGVALIEVEETSGQNEIVVILGACSSFTLEEVDSRADEIRSADILLCQLETNPEATERAISIAREAGIRVILNPAPAAHLSDELLAKIDYITPNETEAMFLTGIEVTDADSAHKAAARLMEKGIRNVIITLGSAGYYITDGRREALCPPMSDIKVVETTGAGDAFNGGFAAALASGMDFFEAAAFGNIAGGLSVTRKGTAPAMPYLDEIRSGLLRCSR